MKSVFVLGALLVASTQAYVEDMTPYRTVIGGSPTPSMIAASSAAVPAGYHVQMSYVRDATRKTVPYTYGAPIRAESIPQGTAMRAPTMMQPEMAFVPTLASSAPASADDLPVHAATAFPAPPAAPFASFLEAQAASRAEAELDAELEADLDFAASTETETETETEGQAELGVAAAATQMVEAESKAATATSLSEGIAEAAAFAEELEAVLETGDAAELERERQEAAFRAATGGAAPEAEQEIIVHDNAAAAAFLETEAEAEVDAEAQAEAEAEAELDAEVDEDLDLEEEGGLDAEAEAEAEMDVDADAEAEAEAEGEQEFEAEFDA